jgi:hypothetical protein
METQVLYNSDFHFEHVQWNSEILYWENELNFFNIRIEELVTRWTDDEVLDKLEHYQNEFILHDGFTEELQETIEKHETQIACLNRQGKDSLNTTLLNKHLEYRNKMETQRQVYADLKKEFFHFLSKYL